MNKKSTQDADDLRPTTARSPPYLGTSILPKVCSVWGMMRRRKRDPRRALNFYKNPTNRLRSKRHVLWKTLPQSGACSESLVFALKGQHYNTAFATISSSTPEMTI